MGHFFFEIVLFCRNSPNSLTWSFFGSKWHYCENKPIFQKNCIKIEIFNLIVRELDFDFWGPGSEKTFGYHFLPSVVLNQAHHRPCITICHVIIYGFSRDLSSRDSSPEFLFLDQSHYFIECKRGKKVFCIFFHHL